MSLVSNVIVGDSAVESTRKAMNLAGWRKFVKQEPIILKVNAVWDRVRPGTTTSPMVIEGVLQELTEAGFKDITIVDTDTPAFMNVNKSFKVLGILKLARKYGVKVVRLTTDKFVEASFPHGKVLHKQRIAKTLADAKTIITLPILKTHGITKMTAALKNQWGCIHDLRHNEHLHVDQAIADVNHFYKDKINFCVMDAIICQEGEGPKSGTPIIVGNVLASHDLVSIDAAAATIMGYAPTDIKHIINSEQCKVGEMKFTILGDPLPQKNFRKAKQNFTIKFEMACRGTFLDRIMFKTPLVLFWFRLAARIYYEIWDVFVGMPASKRILKTKFGKMWSRHIS